MTSKKLIEDFLSENNVAVVGVSRNKWKFGYIVYKELKSKGYNVFPVNPNTTYIDGEKSYPSLLALKGKVGAAILVIPPLATNEAVKDANAAGIKKIWLQNGAESEEAVTFCRETGIDIIQRECVLMFAEPSGFIHKAHKWIWGVVGKLPE